MNATTPTSCIDEWLIGEAQGSDQLYIVHTHEPRFIASTNGCVEIDRMSGEVLSAMLLEAATALVRFELAKRQGERTRELTARSVTLAETLSADPAS